MFTLLVIAEQINTAFIRDYLKVRIKDQIEKWHLPEDRVETRLWPKVVGRWWRACKCHEMSFRLAGKSS
jgi:hypothetical protein